MGMNRISISILHQPKVQCTHSTGAVTAPRLKLHVFRIRHNSVSTESSHSKAYQVPIQEQAEHSERDRDLVQKIRRQRLWSAHQGRHAEGQRVHLARGERLRDEH